MQSVWQDLQLPSFAPLRGDLKTDVLIIGGGLAGILCAFFLQQSGVDYALAEADTICGGVTAGTTAKITAQHGLIYDKLLKSLGAERAAMYLQANLQALQTYARLCEKADCDYQVQPSFVYSVDNRGKIEREIRALQRLGYPAVFAEHLQIPVTVSGAVGMDDQAQFHPLKFVRSFARVLRIYEHTPIRELRGTQAITDHGRITAGAIIVATHFPFLNKHGGYFLKMFQHRSYVLGLRNAPTVEGMYVDEADDGLSFRNTQDLLLLGGGGHKTGKPGGGWHVLEKFAAMRYPDACVQYRWAAQDCMTLDSVPYIGRYSARTQNLYVATGFNKWGITGSMAAALLLTDLVTGRDNPFAPLFHPSRNMLKPQLFINGGNAVANLLTFSRKRCPHLGCALKWNPAEHSWDCPCHGSRFAEDGALLDNPATGPLKK